MTAGVCKTDVRSYSWKAGRKGRTETGRSGKVGRMCPTGGEGRTEQEDRERKMVAKVQIMIVEDDAALAGEIKHFLERWGYAAHVAADFEDVVAECERRRPALVLMDVNLPFYDGFYWCRKLREVSEVPVLFVSSRGEDGDKLQAYAQGGDDYVEKPFRLEILRAKIEAILRRTGAGAGKSRIGLGDGVYFEQEGRSLVAGGSEVELTKSEKKILARLVEERGRIVTREELMTMLWSTDEFVSDGTLTTLVSRLRSKLTTRCGGEIIKTRKGEGYYITCQEKD